MRVENKVALVTGGTRGIGLGIARKLAEAGFTLAITGRRPADQVQPVLEQLKKHSRHSIYVQADVASASDRRQLLQTVEGSLAGWMFWSTTPVLRPASGPMCWKPAKKASMS
jgi:NAD(P)-dependent dehydrogenase (short-subunit alcohol dehydrogenase family)